MFLELRYIPEWIEYHRYLGFDFVHLYDNNPTFLAQNLTKTYGDFVRVTHAPNWLHWDATKNCLAQYEGKPWWVAEIDSDEFIVLHKHDNIKQMLADVVPNGGSLSLNWYIFGSNGHRRDNGGLVVERFLARAKEVHKVVKSISYIPDVIRINCHNPTLRKGVRQVDTRGHKFIGAMNTGGPTDVAQINHYITKSLDECHQKTHHHRSDGSNHTSAYCPSMDINEVQDSAAWDFYMTKKWEARNAAKQEAKAKARLAREREAAEKAARANQTHAEKN